MVIHFFVNLRLFFLHCKINLLYFKEINAFSAGKNDEKGKLWLFLYQIRYYPEYPVIYSFHLPDPPC